MIKSRTTNYFNAQFPALQWVYEFFYVTFFIIWMLGVILGIYLISTDASTGITHWTIGWTGIGIFVFYLSFKWRIGTQRINVIGDEIIISKKFLFISSSKRIKPHKINKLEIKPFEPYNPLTGTELKPKNKLAWLRINDDSLYYLNSYLYPEDELQQIINNWKSSI